MLKLKLYIEILASLLTIQQKKDAVTDEKCLKAIMITEDDIIYPTMSILRDALLKEFDKDISGSSIDELTDLNSSLTSRFDDKEVLDENEDAEQFNCLAVITDLSTILTCQDYLKLEYDQIINDENLESLSNEVMFDLSESFISTVFITVQKNLIYKNEVNQYLIMEMIGPLDNPLQ
ncbi:8885_t:CDS:2 [Racocetra fulgida]|uniref:8885_t:CDS:1 n=1 Tax=Racocetra fulgida TaxID=60492 RepID=A0A9N9BX36_9GLOM|nr:8885_t:CDS:2 [Racocetra fulgida]